MKYFMIVCSRGHCGTNRNTEIKFAFEAKTLLNAQDMARKMPSVKHTRMVLSAYEISKEEYIEYRKVSAYNRFPQGRR